MRRITAILIVLLSLCSSASARDKGFEIGVEWGYFCNYLSVHHFVFNAEEGYLIDASEFKPYPWSNGIAGVNARYMWTRKIGTVLNLSWQGIGKHMQTITPSLSVNYQFDQTQFIYFGAGYGFRIDKEAKDSGIITSGYGRRYELGQRGVLGFKVGTQMAYTHPEVYERNSPVPHDKVRISEALVFGLNATLFISISPWKRGRR